MTCLEVQGLATPFLNDKLDQVKLEDYLYHVNHCAACKEELEVYYTLLTGMKLLDEDRNLSNNFHLDFENKLRKVEDRILKRKLQLFQKKVILVLIMGAIAFLTNFGIGEYTQKDIIPSANYKVNGAFEIQNYYFENKETKLYDIYFQNYQVFYQNGIENTNMEINPIKGDTDGK
jgi:hypothetical protein